GQRQAADAVLLGEARLARRGGVALRPDRRQGEDELASGLLRVEARQRLDRERALATLDLERALEVGREERAARDLLELARVSPVGDERRRHGGRRRGDVERLAEDELVGEV